MTRLLDVMHHLYNWLAYHGLIQSGIKVTVTFPDKARAYEAEKLRKLEARPWEMANTQAAFKDTLYGFEVAFEANERDDQNGDHATGLL